MSVEIRLYTDSEGKNECTFVEYKRLKLNLRDNRAWERDVRSVDLIGEPRYGEPKYFYTNKKEFGYTIKKTTSKQFIDTMRTFINGTFVSLDTVKGDKDIRVANYSLVFMTGHLVIELMQEHEDLI